MKKKANYTLLLMVLSLTIYGQGQPKPKIKWQKSLGGDENDYSHSIDAISGGGFFVGGYTDSNNENVHDHNGPAGDGDPDYWVTKLSEEGGLDFTKCYGGLDYDASYQLIATSDGGFIMVGITIGDPDAQDDITYGVFYGSPNFDSESPSVHSTPNTWIVKCNAAGTIEWETLLGTLDVDQGFAVTEHADGHFSVAGVTSSHHYVGPGTDQDIIIFHIHGGNVISYKTFGHPGDDLIHSIQATDDGGHIFVANAPVDMNPHNINGSNNPIYQYKGQTDFWVVKCNNAGDIEWHKHYGGTLSDVPLSIKQVSSGGNSSYVIAGYSTSNNSGNVSTVANRGQKDYWVINIDLQGNLLWEKLYGGTFDDVARDVDQDENGDIVVVGSSKSNDMDITNTYCPGNHGQEDFWVLKLDVTNGEKIWDVSLGGSNQDVPHSIKAFGSPAKYVIAGSSNSNDKDLKHGDPIPGLAESNPINGNHGKFDSWVVELEEVTKLESIQCNYEDLNLYGSFYIAAIPGGKNYEIKIQEMYGNPMYDYEIQAPACSTCTTVTKSNFSILEYYNYYLAFVRIDGGSWGNSCIFYTNPSAMYRSSRPDNGESFSISTYPNPATREEINIVFNNFKALSNRIDLKVYNLLGEEVHRETFTHNNSDLIQKMGINKPISPGTYILDIVVNGEKFNEKIQIK